MTPRHPTRDSGASMRPPNTLFPGHPGPVLRAARGPGSPRPKRRRERPAAPAAREAPAPSPGHAPGAAGSGRIPPGVGPRRRVIVGAVLVGAWAALILGQLLRIQVLDHQTMVQRADSQHHHELTIPPFRGRIHDRNGRPLALTVAVDSVYAVPPDYAEADIPEAAARLAACLRAPADLVERRLRRASLFSWLKRKAEADEVACARETGLPVGTIEEYARFYPGGPLAAHALGFVGADNDGLGGVEFALDHVLRGEPGRRTVWTDGRRTGQGSRVVRESRPGADIELTIDSYLQAVAEEELERGIAEFSATSGAAILVEPATGEVLAMAAAPSFDPNRSGDYPAATLVNRSLTDPYEPGSVFKIFTAAAALNEGVTDEDEEFDTFEGRYRVGSRVVRDWRALGPLTFAGVIQRSSNIGALQVASRLGSETLGEYLNSFGFGEPTGLGLGGESRGIVPRPGVWRPIRLATVSFGQGIAVTPVQLVQGVNAIAAGGVRVPLRLIRGIGGDAEPLAAGRRVVNPATAARVAGILAGAVLEGTGGNAAVPGFSIAGKTGTAQKARPGGYSETEYTASFAGFAPTRDPLFTGVVILDVEKPNHSGANAALVFGRIAERALWRDRRTGWGTERLVASGRRLRHAGPRPAAGPAPASARADSARAATLSARDRIALRLRMEDGAATPETDLIAYRPETAPGFGARDRQPAEEPASAGTGQAGSAERPAGSAIPAMPSGAGAPPAGPAAEDGARSAGAAAAASRAAPADRPAADGRSRPE